MADWVCCVFLLVYRFWQMSREKDKKTGCRYFDLNVLCGVNEEGAAFRSFVDRYGTYVFKRADGFNARFQVTQLSVTACVVAVGVCRGRHELFDEKVTGICFCVGFG